MNLLTCFLMAGVTAVVAQQWAQTNWFYLDLDESRSVSLDRGIILE